MLKTEAAVIPLPRIGAARPGHPIKKTMKEYLALVSLSLDNLVETECL